MARIHYRLTISQSCTRLVHEIVYTKLVMDTDMNTDTDTDMDTEKRKLNKSRLFADDFSSNPSRSISSDHEVCFDCPNSMAPEQWSPGTHGPLSEATDVWGFACTLLEVLTGAVPVTDRNGYLRVTYSERLYFLTALISGSTGCVLFIYWRC